MAQDRINFHILLQDILENNNVDNTHCYFSKPPNTGMKYPCIIYKLQRRNVKKADNLTYFNNNSYSVTYITTNPDDVNVGLDILQKFSKYGVSFDRAYVADNLYHETYIVHY